MYFPTAEIELNPLVPPLVAFMISFFTSMGGVSGAFLILPFQVSALGYNSPSVSATNQLFNIVAIPSGVYRYIKEGRMVWPLTWVVIIGTLPGVLLGAILRCQYLPEPTNFKLFAGFVLLYIGCSILKDLIIKKGQYEKNKFSAEEEFQKIVRNYHRKRTQPLQCQEKIPAVIVRRFNFHRLVYEFYGQTFDINTIGIMSVSFIVGIIGGVYGIGGGAIIAPFFVSFFGLPVYTIAGATLMGTFVTSFAGVTFYQFIAPFYPGMAIAPDWTLGILFGIGGTAGMYCGARVQKFIPAKIIKFILAACILFTATRYIGGFFIS